MDYLKYFILLFFMILSSCNFGHNKIKKTELWSQNPIELNQKISSKVCPQIDSIQAEFWGYVTPLKDTFKIAVYQSQNTATLKQAFLRLPYRQQNRMVLNDNFLLCHNDSIHSQTHSNWLKQISSQLQVNKKSQPSDQELLPSENALPNSFSHLSDTLWGIPLGGDFICQSYQSPQYSWQVCTNKNDLEKAPLHKWIELNHFQAEKDYFWKYIDNQNALIYTENQNLVVIGGNAPLPFFVEFAQRTLLGR